MAHLFYLQSTWTFLIVLSGVILWLSTLQNSPKTDTVTIYYLQTYPPPINALKDVFDRSNAGLTAATYSLAAWYDINSTCIDPSTERLLWLKKPEVMGQLPMVVSSPASVSILATVTQQPELLTSPLCQCIALVLVTFNSKNPSSPMADRIKAGNDAYNACFSTNMHTPMQKQMLSSNLNLEKIKTRRAMSKVSLVLIICLSLAFNYVYSLLDFVSSEDKSKPRNRMVYLFMFIIAIAQWLLPLAFSEAAETLSILWITSFLIGSGIVFEIFLAEFGWRYLKTSHRMVYIHPYVFYTTLASLVSIALFEHGVFDLAVFVYYILISQAIACAYTSTIFFAHFNSRANDGNVDVHTIMGYLVVIAAGVFLIANAASPSFPMGCTINYMWILPWIYTVYVFGFTNYLDHILSNVKEDYTKKTTIGHLYSLGNALVVSVVIGYYAIKYYQVTYGDTTLSNADEAFPLSTSMNFALQRNPGLPFQYLIN